MLECRACVSRCIRAIAGDVLATQRSLALTPRLETRSLRRGVATARAPRPKGNDVHTDERFADFPDPEPRNDIFAEPTTPKAVAKANEKALRQELTWLKDPVKFAQHVHYTLRNEQPDKALDLCRLASKEQNVVVAWNHVLNWYVQNRRINRAIEIYNEMKKRGQFPDSYTYMMLLRGYAQEDMQAHPKELHNYMLKALNIYHSMNGPTSRVKPGIIHTNAMLRLCGLAHDMDALWGVASKIPEHGPGSADNVTYKTLLSAIRYGAFGGNEGIDEENEHVSVEQIAPRKQQAVDEGRRIWQEVIAKWRSGEIQVDQGLVCEMARLLLFSARLQDWDDVFDLVQQTTNVERLIPKIGSPGRHTEHIRIEGGPESQLGLQEDEDGWVSTPAEDAFKPTTPLARDPKHPKRPSSLVWVQPGNAILNVLILVCTQLRIPKTAVAYWDKLTSDEYGLEADMGNFKDMMRLHRVNRNSAGVIRLLKQMPEVGATPNNVSYRIAMSCCMRDWKNHNIMQTATEMIDSMEEHLEVPDVQTLSNFISLALKTEDTNKIATALRRMDRTWEILRSKGIFDSDEVQSPDELPLHKDDVVSFLKEVIGAYDTLRPMLPEGEWESHRWEVRRSQLNSFLSRLAIGGRSLGRKILAKARRDKVYERTRQALYSEDNRELFQGSLRNRKGSRKDEVRDAGRANEPKRLAEPSRTKQLVSSRGEERKPMAARYKFGNPQREGQEEDSAPVQNKLNIVKHGAKSEIFKFAAASPCEKRAMKRRAVLSSSKKPAVKWSRGKHAPRKDRLETKSAPEKGYADSPLEMAS